MALSIGELTGYLSLNADRFRTGLDGALGLFREKAGTFGAIAITAGATAVAGLTGIGASLDKHLDAIVISSGATGDALIGLQDDFKAVAASVPVDMGVVSSAIGDLNTMTGATGEVLQDMTRQVLEGSRMLGEDGAANAAEFGRALTQWQIPAEAGAGHLDTLFRGTQQYGIGLGETIGQLTEYGSVLQNAGFTMDEATVLFGSLNQAGISVSRIMPGLNAAFRRWAGEGKNSQEELRNVIDAIETAEDSTKALAIATDAFGAEGAQRLTTAVRSGAFSLDELSTALDGAEGAIADTAEQTNSFGETWDTLKNRVLIAVQPAATALFDTFSDGALLLVESVGPAISAVTEFLQENQTVLTVLGILIGAVFIPHLIALGVQATIAAARSTAAWLIMRAQALASAAVHSAQIAMMIGRWALLGAQSLLHAARVAAAWVLAMGPLGWVIAAVVGLVALIIANWETVKEVTAAVWSAISDWVRARVDDVLAFIGWLGEIPGKVRDFFARARDGAVDRLTSLVDWVKGLPGRILSAVGNLGTLLLDKGKDVVRGLWNGITGMGGWLRDKLTGWAKNLVPGPIARALGISSPAKVLADEVGRWIPAGVVEGIEAGSPALDRAMRDLVEIPPVNVAVRGGDGADWRGHRPGDDNGRPPAAGAQITINEASSPRETAEHVAVILDHAGGS